MSNLLTHHLQEDNLFLGGRHRWLGHPESRTPESASLSNVYKQLAFLHRKLQNVQRPPSGASIAGRTGRLPTRSMSTCSKGWLGNSNSSDSSDSMGGAR
jgi:hypothetical protein